MRRLLGAVITSILVFISGFAYAGCLQDGGTLLQSLNCLGLPTIDKYFQSKTFRWGTDNGDFPEIEVLSLNRGNELSFWKLTNPASPVAIPGSYFHVGNQGDSDHDLRDYSICDACQFGVASYKLVTVVFDMGTGAQPAIGNKFSKYASSNIKSSFTYKSNDGYQYIISKDLPGAGYNKLCIFRVTAHNNLLKIRDFPLPAGLPTLPVDGGFDFGENLMLNIGGTFYIYRKSGDNVVFVRSTGIRVRMGSMISAAVSGNRMVTGQATTAENGLRLWNISNPVYPSQLFVYPGRYNAVAFSGRHVVTGNTANEIKTFGVEGNTLVPVDWAFWNPDNPWNDWPDECTFFQGGAFSSDGNWAYISRYSVFQKINFSGCGGATPTPTPTPPPWPTPYPTCVPNCVNND